MLALVLSIIYPGLGQFYYGKNIRGLLMLLLALTPLYPVAIVWTVIDILILNKKGSQPIYSKDDVSKASKVLILIGLIVPLCIFITVFGFYTILGWYSDNYIKPKNTVEEGQRIVQELLDYADQGKRYPKKLNELTKGNPIRSGWLTDSWNQEYIYETFDNGTRFTLISKGKDKKHKTVDDIIFK